MPKSKLPPHFVTQYGPWALVAGASEGLGAAFATHLAAAGLNLVLVARRKEIVDAFAADLTRMYGVQTLPLALDLADAQVSETITDALGERRVRLLVYNAACSPVGPFVAQGIDALNGVVNVNVRGPLLLIHRLLPGWRKSGGGILLMSSLAGNQGTPNVAAYSASKAFTTMLGQSLWYELRPMGIDVTVCCAGAIRTPGYLRVGPDGRAQKAVPGTMDATDVALTALRALGKKPFVIPGFVNRLVFWFLSKTLSRRQAVGVMGSAMKGFDISEKEEK